MGSSWAERGVIEGDFQKKFLFSEAFYSKEMNLWPQKKIHSKGYRNGKVCYFLSSLFSDHSASPHPHAQKSPQVTCRLTYLWGALIKQQGRAKASGVHRDSSPNSQAWAPRRREPTEALRKRNQLTPFHGFYLFLREKKNPHNYVIINEKIFLHYLQKQFIKRLGYLIGVSKMTF